MTDTIDSISFGRRALFRTGGMAAAGLGLASLGAPLMAAPKHKMHAKSSALEGDVGVMQGALALEQKHCGLPYRRWQRSPQQGRA